MQMHKSFFCKLLIVLGCGVLLHLPVCADQIAQAGRQIISRYQNSLVTIKITLKIHATMDGEQHSEDEQSETMGTIIDPSGLIVASLATADPAETIASMASEHENMKVSTEIVDLTIRTADGTEMPGKIVVRDKDLDLAFIRPLKKPTVPLTALNLNTGSTPGMLDQMVIMYRLGNIASRTISITLDRLQAVVQKPRTFYVPGVAAMSTRLGAPVFGLDGNPIGLLLLHTSPESSSGMSALSNGIGESNALYIVLPARDIAELAKDVPAVTAVKNTPVATKVKPAAPAVK